MFRALVVRTIIAGLIAIFADLHYVKAGNDDIARDFGSAVGAASADDSTINTAFIIIAVVISLIILFLILSSLYQRVTRILIDRSRFKTRLAKLGFDSQDMGIMQKIKAASRSPKYLPVIESIDVFNNGVIVFTEAPREIIERLRVIRERLGFNKTPTGKKFISTRELDVGQRISASFTAPSGSGAFKGEVSDVDDSGFYISLPSDDSIKSLTKGSKIVLEFWRRNEAAYSVTTSVRGIVSDGPTKLASLNHTRQIAITQQRDFVRVETRIPIIFREISVENAGNQALTFFENSGTQNVDFDREKIDQEYRAVVNEKRAEYYTMTGIQIGQSKNISGGGVLVECMNDFPAGTQIELKFRTGPRIDDPTINFIAEINGSNQNKETGLFDLRITFAELNEGERMEIQQFLYKRQLLKK